MPIPLISTGCTLVPCVHSSVHSCEHNSLLIHCKTCHCGDGLSLQPHSMAVNVFTSAFVATLLHCCLCLPGICAIHMGSSTFNALPCIVLAFDVTSVSNLDCAETGWLHLAAPALELMHDIHLLLKFPFAHSNICPKSVRASCKQNLHKKWLTNKAKKVHAILSYRPACQN